MGWGVGHTSAEVYTGLIERTEIALVYGMHALDGHYWLKLRWCAAAWTLTIPRKTRASIAFNYAVILYLQIRSNAKDNDEDRHNDGAARCFAWNLI